MNDLAIIIVFLAPPIWFPVLRLAVSLLPSFKVHKAAVWFYAISFSWAFGWCLFQWAIKVPSGVGYGLALMTAWPILLIALIIDGVTIFLRKP